jgi:hypothetical protein
MYVNLVWPGLGWSLPWAEWCIFVTISLHYALNLRTRRCKHLLDCRNASEMSRLSTEFLPSAPRHSSMHSPGVKTSDKRGWLDMYLRKGLCKFRIQTISSLPETLITSMPTTKNIDRNLNVIISLNSSHPNRENQNLRTSTLSTTWQQMWEL